MSEAEKTAKSKETFTPSEPELLPEERAGPREIGDEQISEGAGPSPFQAEILHRLGDLVQQALQDQVTPTLQEMVRHQTLVETRLHMLENERDEDRLALQASLLHLSEDGTAGTRDVYKAAAGPVPVPGRAGAERVEATSVPVSRDPGGGHGSDNGVGSRNCLDGKNSVRLAVDGWRATTATCFSRCSERRERERRETGLAACASASEVLSSRATSPFRHFADARSESGDLVREQLGMPRQLRATVSDPVGYREAPKKLGTRRWSVQGMQTWLGGFSGPPKAPGLSRASSRPPPKKQGNKGYANPSSPPAPKAPSSTVEPKGGTGYAHQASHHLSDLAPARPFILRPRHRRKPKL